MQVTIYSKTNHSSLLETKQKQFAENAFCRGLEYEFGRSGPKNIPAAIECYKEAAQLGFIRAHVRLGYLYQDAQDLKESARRFTIAAEFGESDAQIQLFLNSELEDNKKKGLFWLSKAMQQLDPQAFMVAATAAKQNGDSKKSLGLKLCAAVLGHPIAQKEAADELIQSPNKEDQMTAATLYGEAISRGSCESVAKFVTCCSEGKGVQKNPFLALQICEKAAQEGNAEAMYKLGIIYEQGDLIGVNKIKALSYYKMAALSGYGAAADLLGEIYLGDVERLSVTPDPKQAFYWFTKGVALQYMDSFYSLASMYADGEVVPQDMRTAVALFRHVDGFVECKCQAVFPEDLYKNGVA